MLLRIVHGTLASALCGLLVAPAAAQTDDGRTWHAETVTYGEAGPAAITNYWSKGRKLRSTTIVLGRPVLTIVNGEWYHAIDELGGVGLAIQRSSKALAADRKGGRPFGNEAEQILDQGAERVRTEELAGSKVDVYRKTDYAGRREVWVAREGSRLPLRFEVFDRAAGRRRRTDYLGWTRELEIPDAFFEPDPRVKLERLSYEEYVDRISKGKVGPVPVLYGALLHGR